MNPTLGKLERVTLRDYWKKEATEFTPWLSDPENLNLLAETLDINLELEDTETNVGPFRADILCRDPDRDEYVLIENQLERTDHTHLGQILTYAAGLDAVQIIWVAQQFTDEHRAALDWLNRITAEDFNFFGVEIELWKIGDSMAAPKFNLVAKPNEWSKRIRGATSAKTSERHAIYHQLWRDLTEYLNSHFPTLNVPKPTGMVWLRFQLEANHLNLSYSMANKKLNHYLLFRGDNAEKWAKFVEDDLENFQRDIGVSFEWIPDTGGIAYGTISKDFDHTARDAYSSFFHQTGELISKIEIALAERYKYFKDS